jgi:hypothetical protein
MYDKVVKIEFNVWADSEQEGEDLKKAIVDFINYHGQQGRKVSAPRLTEAIRKWQDNVLVRNSIIKHFS